jgi:exopolysaccharide biosynthesis operon protein EpsL
LYWYQRSQRVIKAACRSAALVSAFPCVAAALAPVGPPPLTVADGNTYDFYVAGQEQYDSNLYRLPSNYGTVATLVAPNASRSDLISSISAGGDGQWIASRQVFEINLRADENRFAHNDELNNTSAYGNLLWNWELGGHFSGEAGATYNRALANFAETRDLGRDLTDAVRYFGTARYQVGPQWALYGGISDLDITHSAKQAQYNDFHQKDVDAGIELDTSPDDNYAVEYRYTDGGFPPSTLNGFSSASDYHEALVRMLVKYVLSDKTQIDAYAGYRKRDFTATEQRAFSGAVGHVGVNWSPTDKTQLIFTAWHELRSYASAESDYFVSNGGNISPVWIATEKLRFAFVVSYEKQDFISESTSVIALGPLNAKITTEQMNVTYTPRSSWIFNLSLNHQKRDSNQPTYAFDDQLAAVSVLYRIH